VHVVICTLSTLLGIKIINDGKRRAPKNDESQDYRNSDCFIVVVDSFYPEQAGSGHKAALCHGYDAISPAFDYYFHNGLYSGAYHSQLRAAEASQARKAIVRTCAGPGDRVL
jgi:hypothetical protein